jgi:hypothetical protein
MFQKFLWICDATRVDSNALSASFRRFNLSFDSGTDGIKRVPRIRGATAEKIQISCDHGRWDFYVNAVSHSPQLFARQPTTTTIGQRSHAKREMRPSGRKLRTCSGESPLSCIAAAVM